MPFMINLILEGSTDQYINTVVNKNTSGDNRMYLSTKLQNVLLKPENNTVNTSFAKSQSIVLNLTVSFANINTSFQVLLFLHFYTNYFSFPFFPSRSSTEVNL
ncbi:unnamed protein product [Schistosoma bovis]|nr:unnamed protein product [Schistosoma bovis]